MSSDHADPDNAGAIHHLELYTSDLDASTRFWEWLLTDLGYTVKNDWERGRSWLNEPTYVVMVAAPHPTDEFDRRAPGLNHVAFHARSRDQVDRLTNGVRQRDDARVLYEEDHPYAGGYYALYCEGPEGTKVEVVAPDID